MNFVANNIDIQDAYSKVREYDYALIYMMSELVFCNASQLSDINWEECMEARFFSRDKELHMYLEDGSLKAVEIVESAGCDKLVKEYQLGNRFLGVGKKLIVHEYISYDEDGQAMVECTRLVGVE